MVHGMLIRLTHCRGTPVWLTRANLVGANLVGANLDWANLDWANLDGEPPGPCRTPNVPSDVPASYRPWRVVGRPSNRWRIGSHVARAHPRSTSSLVRQPDKHGSWLLPSVRAFREQRRDPHLAIPGREVAPGVPGGDVEGLRVLVEAELVDARWLPPRDGGTGAARELGELDAACGRRGKRRKEDCVGGRSFHARIRSAFARAASRAVR